MAASNLNLGKASGGVLNVQPADGTTNTSLVLPASGVVVATDVAVTDNAIARYDGTTGKVQNSGVIIDDNNNIGIGTSSPEGKVHIKAASGAIALKIGNTGDATAMEVTSTTNTGTTFNQVDGGNRRAITFKQEGIDVLNIDSAGRLLVGSNGLNPIQGVTIRNESTIGVVDIGHASGTASGNQYNGYYYNGTLIGSILQSGTTSVVYNTTSDYRLKENIRPADCKKFMDINFVDYERIDGRHECGVIAHELQEVYPDLVTGEKDATEIRKVEISPAIEEVKDEDGNVITEAVEAVYEEQEFPVYQQVNYIGLIARIGTVVQQQAKLMEAMQLEINELKGAK